MKLVMNSCSPLWNTCSILVAPSLRLMARAVRARLENSRMEEIFQQGMHEFIGEFIDNNNRLGAAITEQYLM